ncbi:response regulator [Gottschalkiaceae bacterium SANA]|nr:response regulator [Gottschalkiaceae bacterium SANA]
MNNRILIVDSDEKSRIRTATILHQYGYDVHQAREGNKALRDARRLHPVLILIDIELTRGMPANELAKIVEVDRISSCLFMSSRYDSALVSQMEALRLYAYIQKPIQPLALIQVIEFSISMSKKILALEEKVVDLETSLEGRKKMDRLKGILMEKKGVSEKEAYGLIRKMSMDHGEKIESTVERMLASILK